ncbi:hypothetical protein CSAL01_06487 [Colletotrichum salicis]|uniref:Uncharacterized protein n=1 Tax=Colletotrichum salicis TaxID=1209931 RepID=A0A135RNN6_9PEZI|nr:hypothetical protein CSAL01_06487 [Colletotrichum salicis]
MEQSKQNDGREMRWQELALRKERNWKEGFSNDRIGGHTSDAPYAHKRTQHTQPSVRTYTARFREHGLMPPTCDEHLRVSSQRVSLGDAGPSLPGDVGSHLTSNTA